MRSSKVLLKIQPSKAFIAFKCAAAETSHEEILKENFDVLRRRVAHEVEDSVTFASFLQDASLRRRCWIGFLAFFGAQYGGSAMVFSA